MGFAHLHVHTEYSLLDGVCRIQKLVRRVRELGQSSVAITDHGNLYGAVEFYRACKAEGIHPVIGCEVYVAPRSMEQKVPPIDSKSFHLVLLCENEQGYRNLCKLSSLAYIDGFYRKPRVDKQCLANYHEGLIALSGCVGGEIPQALLNGDERTARELIRSYSDIFGKDSFYIELQDHQMEREKKILNKLIALAREEGIGLVATNDVHYLNKEDARLQQIVLCIQQGKTLEEKLPLGFETDEFYLKSEGEMKLLFGEIPEALENTVRIAERCQFDFTFGRTKLPAFTPPDGTDNRDYFLNLCKSGLHYRYGQHPSEAITNRFFYEIQVIESMGFINYFLIVQDFVHYAKAHGIAVGPGRGSGAGSLIAYCLEITGIDPIRYDLLFERFLNPERISMPDFDIDFCNERRQEVIRYVIEKYGADHVAQIVTFGVIAARGAVRDIGRVLGMKYADVDRVAKAIPSGPGVSIKQALERSKELRAMFEKEPRVHEFIEMARQIEGIPRNVSTHAAAVVITKDPVVSYVPLAKNEGNIVTQYTMNHIADLGLLKMDFLGLRNLTVIQETERSVQTKAPSFLVSEISIEDRPTYQMLSNGGTKGVFQMESAGMTRVLSKIKPRSLEDLIAVLSLYRPGPSQFIDTFIENRRNPNQIVYRHEKLRHILEVTYGVIVYQEQVMQIFRELAGYSLGRADLVRRAIAKKKADVLKKEREYFLYGKRTADGKIECSGAIANGIEPEIAAAIFDDMSSFASYAFNKSHAAAYALLAYQTAYLKRHYPGEYFAALFNSVLDRTDKLSDYFSECKKYGFTILLPDINLSEVGFSASGKQIRFGLLGIRGIGRALVDKIVAERTRAPFLSLQDFVLRLTDHDLNRIAIEALIKSGAFDSFSENRKQMLTGLRPLISFVQINRNLQLGGQLDLFHAAEQEQSHYQFPKATEYERETLLQMEREAIGICISSHPLEKFQKDFSNFSLFSVTDLASLPESASVRMLGLVVYIKQIRTRSGDSMAFFRLEDQTGTVEVVVFSDLYKICSDLLVADGACYVEGKLQRTEKGECKLLASRIFEAGEVKNELQRKLYLKFNSRSDERLPKIKEIINRHPGFSEVIYYFEDQNKYCRPSIACSVEITPQVYGQLTSVLGSDGAVVRDASERVDDSDQ